MKVVAFNGSPRKGGNTSHAIQTFFKPLKEEGIECEEVQVGGVLLHGCAACMACRKTGICRFTDDPLNDWVAMMREADGIVLASPTYYANLTSEMKALIDRAGFSSKLNGGLYRKVGAPIVVCRRGGAMQTYNSLMSFFGINNMIVPMSSYWNLNIGMNPGDVENDTEGVETMTNLGKNMAWILKKIHA